MFAVTTRRSTDGLGSDLLGLRNRINWFFESPGGIDSNVNNGSSWLPPMDSYEDSDTYYLAFELPGINAEDVSLSVDGNVLTIRGERRAPDFGEHRVHHRERWFGAFERGITLPGDVDYDSIRASYDAGVLYVTLTKPERARARQIPIDVAASGNQ